MNKRLNLKKLIDNFVVYAQEKKIHLYNEAGLQFELAFYLKEKLEKKRKDTPNNNNPNNKIFLLFFI